MLEKYIQPIGDKFIDRRISLFIGDSISSGRPQEALATIDANNSYLFSFLRDAFESELLECFGESVPVANNLAHLSQQIFVASSRRTICNTLVSLLDKELSSSPSYDYLVEILKLLSVIPSATIRSKIERNELERVLIVTATHDKILEEIFRRRETPFHVISFIAKEDNNQLGRSAFRHYLYPNNPQPIIIVDAEAYKGLVEDSHPIILKMYGGIDPSANKNHSFVISEDDYIKLGKENILSLLPRPIPNLLQNNEILFLGYDIRDWNYRVILPHIFGTRRSDIGCWAVQDRHQKGDKGLWDKTNVELISSITPEELLYRLKEYVRTYSG